jgi:hypothetical protein
MMLAPQDRTRGSVIESYELLDRIGASDDLSEALEISEQIVDGQVRFTYKDYRAAPRTRRRR